MAEKRPKRPTDEEMKTKALDCWNNEGGAIAQVREAKMANEERDRVNAERRKLTMESDWDPGYTPERSPPVDRQVANSLDYAAYQLGQINRKLDKLIEAIQGFAAKA